MTTGVQAHLDEAERQFLLSPVVRSFQVRERQEHLQEGFIRLRATLSNGVYCMPEPIFASAVSHVAVCIRNMEASLRFYRDLLGFTVSKDELQDTRTGGLPHLYHDRHAQRRVVHLRYADRHSVPFLVLTEHPGETVSGAPIMLDQVGISHISFTVPNVEALTQRLLAAGARTCGPADAFRDASGRIRTVFFRDPDGILVQFDEGGEG